MSEAAKAYDAARFADASAAYEQVIASGWVAPELFFNAGNTAFRKADIGRAVLNYRRAWSLSPRDAEVVANLRFVQQQAGVNMVLLSPWENAFSRLSLTEWSCVAIAGLWLASLGGALWLLRQHAPRWRRTAISGLALLALGLAGCGFWLDWRSRPEWVVLQPGQQALFAPLKDATPHFALPPGSVVRLVDRSGDWLHVRSGRDVGWIPQSACAPVLPWHGAGSR